MKNQLSNQILERLDTFGLSTTIVIAIIAILLGVILRAA
jgi:hypothetical protein